MKYLIPILFILASVGCKKADKTRHFTIQAEKSEDITGAELKVNNSITQFTRSGTSVTFDLDEFEVKTIDLNGSGLMKIKLFEGASQIKEASGMDFAWMVVSNSSITGNTYTPTTGSGSGTSSGSGSSGACSSVQCSGTTQAGKRCKNKTTNCNGRCYLH